ncbi:MAG: EamA family transporter [Acetobacter sp.]|nr:EamA family transporter [Acetobacter sp.]
MTAAPSSAAAALPLRARLLALSQLLVSMVCIQFGSSIAKSIFPVFGTSGVVGLRVCLAAFMLVPLFRSWRFLSGPVLRLVLPYGLAMTGMNAFFYLALQHIPLGTTVTLEFIGPLVVAFVGSRKLSDIGWILLTILGLALVLNPSASTKTDFAGVGFALLAALCWALYILFGQRVAGKVPGAHACALGMACGACVVFLPCFVPALIIGFSAPAMLGLGVLVAFCSSALPYSLEMLAMQNLSARDIGILSSLEPVCATVAGAVILHETPSPLQLCGILCVVAASAGIILSPGTSKQKAAPARDVPELPN